MPVINSSSLIDTNPTSPDRQRRNWQKILAGAINTVIKLASPSGLTNGTAGLAIQPNGTASGLTLNTGGISVVGSTVGAIQVTSAGVGVLVDGSTITINGSNKLVSSATSFVDPAPGTTAGGLQFNSGTLAFAPSAAGGLQVSSNFAAIKLNGGVASGLNLTTSGIKVLLAPGSSGLELTGPSGNGTQVSYDLTMQVGTRGGNQLGTAIPPCVANFVSGTSTTAITNTTALTDFDQNFNLFNANVPGTLPEGGDFIDFYGWFTATVSIANTLSLALTNGSVTLCTPLSVAAISATTSFRIKVRLLILAVNPSAAAIAFTEITNVTTGVTTLAKVTGIGAGTDFVATSIQFAAQWGTANADSVTNDFFSAVYNSSGSSGYT